MTTSLRARALACALLAGTFYTGLAATPAAAQGSPTFRNLDGNGVDLTRGDFLTGFPEGSIGSGEAELALLRMVGAVGVNGASGSSQWDHVVLNLVSSGTYVDFGSHTDKFPGAEARGATLSGSGDSYVYVAADGTQTSFGDPSGNSGGGTTNFCDNSGTQASCMLVPTGIVSPDGKAVTLEYEFWRLCIRSFDPDVPIDCTYTPRLSRVSNSFGYSVAFSYASAAGNSVTSNPPATFRQRTGATFSNSAAGSSALASVSYSYPSSGVVDVTDTGGRTWRVTSGSGYYGIRRPGASSDTLGASLSGGIVTSVTNAGVTTGYSRSVSGSTATTVVANALSQATTIVSDLTTGRPTSVTDPLSHTTSYSYDSSGRLTRTTAPEGNYVETSYDSRGNAVQTQAVAKSGSGLATLTTNASYDSTCSNPVTCNRPNSVTDARGNATDYTYDSTHGGVLTVTGPAPTSGATRPQTRYSYTLTNGEYRLTGTSQCVTGSSCAGTADEAVTSLAYDSNGNVTSSSAGNGSGTLTAASAMTYDYLGNLLTVDGPLSGTADTIRYRYNAARQVVGVVSPDPDGSGSLKNRATRTTYTDGLPTKVEQGTVNSQSDTDWAAFSPLQEVNTAYDSNARPSAQNLVSGSTVYALTQTGYDALGRVECVAQRMNPAIFATITTAACSLGTQGTGSNDFGPDRIVRTSYDAAGRVVQSTSAYGVTGQQADDSTSTYTANGLVQTVTDAENNKTSYAYDGLDRLSQTLYPSATKGAGTSNSSDYEQRGYDSNGNVTSFRNRAAETTGFTYDALNRRTFKDLPGSEPDVTYVYDLLGRMTSAATSVQTLSFTYDALGRQLTEAGPQGTVTSAFDIAGRRTRITHPDGFYVDQDYLVTGETSAIRENGATAGVGVLATFAYDDLGRRTSLTRGNGTSTSYSYDGVSRLSSLAQDASGTTYDQTLGFSYSPASQIVQNTRSNDLFAWGGHGSGSTSSTVNGLNQLTVLGGTSTSHDSRGNMTADGLGKTFGYTSENLLTSASGSVSLAYDPAMRLYQVAGSATTRFQYDGADAIAEYNGSNTLQRRYVHGPGTDEPLVWYEGSGTTDRRFLHADERGSVVAVSNSSGTVTNVNTYDEYGKPGSGNVGRFQYTGQKWIADLGLYDYKARMYHPSLGRFMQTDPVGYGDGLNWYIYATNDPINGSDPSGLKAGDLFTTPGAAAKDATKSYFRVGGTEWGGRIYGFRGILGGVYYYYDAQQLGAHKGSINQQAFDSSCWINTCITVAYWHTHNSSPFFSIVDRQSANLSGYALYMGYDGVTQLFVPAASGQKSGAGKQVTVQEDRTAFIYSFSAMSFDMARERFGPGSTARAMQYVSQCVIGDFNICDDDFLSATPPHELREVVRFEVDG